MVNPQHATGRAESSTPDPGTHSTTGPSDEPTLYEFLTRLVSDPAARSAFDSDPQATLDQAGLGGMTATDVLQATSLVLDYAPVEVVTEYDRSLQSSVEKFAASTQHVAINQLHPAHPNEQEDLSMLKNPAPADFGKDSDVDATLPAPSVPAVPATPAGDNVDIDVRHNDTDSHNFISIHDIASGNDIANGNIVGSVVGNTVGQVGDSLALGDVTNVVGNTVSEVNQTATHVFDTSVDLTAGAATVVHGDVTNVVDNSTNIDVLNVVNEAPVVGDIANNVTNVLGDVTTNVSNGDLTSVVTEAPVVGNVVGDVTSVATNIPVAGDLVGNVAGGDITNVTDNVTGVVGDVPVVGGVVDGVVGGVAGGDVHALPVDDVTSALPVGDVTSALPVGDVASALPAPSDLPVVGDLAGGAVEGVTSALPLDGLL
ncbi:IniB N-terminal domain-containing protein [Saccharopolyspora sp. NPDC050389]|uniref:IniB N-terminal domain-containing protein n=1 Tax=Saccharopolyspora sp. NPDC050389 TaxID=3155516 RepID=UPI0033C1724A